MSEIIIVRKERCEGCLYSPNAVAANDAEGRKDIAEAMAADPNGRFFCHCHWDVNDPNREQVCCRGFYDAYKEQLPSARFTKKKGKFWDYWRRGKKGASFYGLPPLTNQESKESEVL